MDIRPILQEHLVYCKFVLLIALVIQALLVTPVNACWFRHRHACTAENQMPAKNPFDNYTILDLARFEECEREMKKASKEMDKLTEEILEIGEKLIKLTINEVDEYNKLVYRHNALVELHKEQIEKYSFWLKERSKVVKRSE